MGLGDRAPAGGWELGHGDRLHPRLLRLVPEPGAAVADGGHLGAARVSREAAGHQRPHEGDTHPPSSRAIRGALTTAIFGAFHKLTAFGMPLNES